MSEDAEKNQELANLTLVRAKISKVEFPEKCPVCLDEPEDLVSVTITERFSVVRGDDSAVSTWADGKDKAELILASARGAVTFWVPTCMLHGSGKLRTGRARFIAWAALFVLFYPALFFLLGINAAIWHSRSLLEPLANLTVILLVFFVLVIYGYYPRALERSLKFIDIDRAKDAVYIDIMNDEYRKLFMDLNAMHADVIQSIRDESLK
ncbi:MAG: hypothetical protein E3J82_02120 [Candidatus Thorarchaeota archaeon]|nr:MAG: hypothetical protein E3J82_02120 [Candidatus Thorarchaeota archaeon]